MAGSVPHWLSTLPSVGDFMDTDVLCVSPDTDLIDAIGQLLDSRVTGAPVVAADGQMVGMLTEKDCLTLTTLGVAGDAAAGPVEKFMDREVISVSSDTDIYYAAGIFMANHFRRLPVVDDGKLVGAITRLDLLRVVHAYLRGVKRYT